MIKRPSLTLTLALAPVLSLALLGALASVAAAEPASTRCYSGTQHVTVMSSTKDEKVTVRRTLDPATSQLRETVWRDGGDGKDMVATIDAKAGTFTFDLDGVKGTGTLTGPAWHWTAQSTSYIKSGVELAISSKLDGDKAHLTGTGMKNGKQIVTIAADLDALDCAKAVPAPATPAK